MMEKLKKQLKEAIRALIGPTLLELTIHWLTIFKRQSSHDDFPNNLKNKKVFELRNLKESNHYRIFPYRSAYDYLSNVLTPNACNRYEILKTFNIDKYENHYFHCDSSFLLPLCFKDNRGTVTIQFQGKNYSIKNIPKNRWTYIPFDPGKGKLSSNNTDVYCSAPMPLNNFDRPHTQRPEHTVLIFIDSLAYLDDVQPAGFDTLMPNTKRFFERGLWFTNHFAESEWTLPSVATIFSGKKVHEHRMVDPLSRLSLPPTKLLSERYHDLGYHTTAIGGGWRNSPSYGYSRGFDRTIYKRMMDASEVVDCFEESIETFGGRSTFTFLTFLEAHHLLWQAPDVSSQSKLTIEHKELTPWYTNEKKSIDFHGSASLSKIYFEEIRRLDRKLKILYDIINNKLGDHATVCLMSDHGPSFLDDEHFLLKRSRMKVPLIIKSKHVPQGKFPYMSSTSEIMDTIMKFDIESPARIEQLDRNNKFILSQSIYPGKSYKATIFTEDNEYHYESVVPVDRKHLFIKLSQNDKTWSKHPFGIDSVTNFKMQIEQSVCLWNDRVKK